MAIYSSSIPLTQGDKKSIKKDSASKQEIMQSRVPCYTRSQENFLNLETDECSLPTGLPCSYHSISRDTFFSGPILNACVTLLSSTIFIASFCLFLASFLCVEFLSLPVSVTFSCLISLVGFSHYVVLFLCPVAVPLSPFHSSYEEVSKGQLVAENKRWPSEPCILCRELFRE